MGTCGAVVSDGRKGKYLVVWCCAQVLWRRREVRLGTEPGSEPRAWDSAPSCECRVGGQVQGGVRTEDSRGARVTGPTAPGTGCCLFPPQAHTLSHTCTCTHTHTLMLTYYPCTHTHTISSLHTRHTLTSMTHTPGLTHTFRIHTHTCSHTLLYTNTTRTQTCTNAP